LPFSVEAALRQCSFTDLPNEPNFTSLVAHWLTDSGNWERVPPPLPDNTIAAIPRRLVASAN